MRQERADSTDVRVHQRPARHSQCPWRHVGKNSVSVSLPPILTPTPRGQADHIIGWLRRVASKARRYFRPNFYFVAFLDEINTTSASAVFKEALVDRTVDGIPLPSNLRLIAAVNPYRLKNRNVQQHLEQRMVGLIFDQHENVYG